MTSLVVNLDDDAAERLHRRAQREGVDVEELAARLLAEASEQDPFEFVGMIDSGVVGADDVDLFLEEHGFGREWSSTPASSSQQLTSQRPTTRLARS